MLRCATKSLYVIGCFLGSVEALRPLSDSDVQQKSSSPLSHNRVSSLLSSTEAVRRLENVCDTLHWGGQQ